MSNANAAQPQSIDPRTRQASQVKAVAHQQAFATGRTSRTAAGAERERPQKKLTPQERAQAAAAEAQRKFQQSELEGNRVRTELRRMQEQLEASKNERTLEAQKAVEREAGLWNELAEVRNLATDFSRKASGYKKILLGVLLVVLPATAWAAVYFSHPETVRAAGRAAVPPAAVAVAQPKNTAPRQTPSAFTDGVDRLSQALDRFNEQPEEVLRRVHAANAARGVSVCSFEWHRGEVSLVFGNEPGTQIGTTMSRCAEAVEKAAR